jgi:putative DNA primase/helicase
MTGGLNGSGGGKEPPTRQRRDGLDAVKTAKVKARPIVVPGQADVPGFEMRTDGLYFTPPGDKAAAFRLAGRFQVVAETRPEDASDGWGLLLRWSNRDGGTVQWIMSRSMLVGEATEVRARLAGGGLNMSGRNDAPQALRKYLLEIQVAARARTVSRCGWYDAAEQGAAFVLPGRTLGKVPGEELLLDISPPPKIYRENGTLEGWRDGVAKLAQGNSRMMFALSLGFAAPLLALTAEEGGIVHLRGGTSQGKTTAAKIAASLYGAPTGMRSFIRKWRATDNGLEGVACEHSDALLVLDEIGQADPKVVGPAAYMLADGQGKSRSRAAGGLRDALTWRLLCLSTGEMSLTDYAARAGYVTKAGQEVRFLDVPIDAGAGFGGFETVSSKEEAGALSMALERAAIANHGTAGPVFIAKIAEREGQDRGLVARLWREYVSAFLTKNVAPGSDGQVGRAARRFALAGMAGEFASKMGLTGWDEGAAERAAATCFRAWLDQRGTHGGREAQQIADALRGFIIKHGASRFPAIGIDSNDYPGSPEALVEGRTVMNRAGWRRPETDEKRPAAQWIYGIAREVFAAELCQPLGIQPNEARTMLADLGLIRAEKRAGESTRRTTVRWRVPGHSRMDLVVVGPELFGDAADDDQVRDVLVR